MVISRVAIRNFLERKLNNSDKVKRFKRKRLLYKCDAIGLQWPKTIEPYTHQLACLLLGWKHSEYLFFLDMGLGKTFVSLLLFHNRKALGKHDKRLLVLAPASANVSTWEDEIVERFPNTKVLALTPEVAGKKRIEKIEEGDYDILISTYAGFLSHVTSKNEKVSKKTNKTTGWVPDTAKIKAFADLFDSVVFDESTAMLRRHDSLMSRVSYQFAGRLRYRYALTGTPHGTSPEHLWSQFRIVDRGKTLGTTLGIFRSAFFLEKKDYWKGKVYEFDGRYTEQLSRMLKHRSVRYEESECLDLPKLVKGTVVSTFSLEAWAYYKTMADELAQSKGDFKACESAFIRMRQISAGFLKIKTPEGGEHVIKFKENPKLDSLVSWLENVPENEKVVIFNEYIVSGELICERLKKEKVSHVRIYGGTRNKGEALKRFKTDPKVKVLVLNNSSGAYGLNLQAATYGAVYESPTDPVVRRQLMKRIHRGGQTKPVFIYDFILRKSKDADILKSIESGEDLFKKIVGDKK